MSEFLLEMEDASVINQGGSGTGGARGKWNRNDDEAPTSWPMEDLRCVRS